MMNDFISLVESMSSPDLVKLCAECDYAIAHGEFSIRSFCRSYIITHTQTTNYSDTIKILDMCQIVAFETMHRVANGTFK